MATYLTTASSRQEIVLEARFAEESHTLVGENIAPEGQHSWLAYLRDGRIVRVEYTPVTETGASS